MPAIYDLANRGLLPPGFSLVGFARRDWADQDFGKIVYEAVKEHARTPFREEVWQHLAEGIRFVPGTFDDAAAFDLLAETVAELDEQRGTGGNHAFYLSIPPGSFSTVCEQLERSGLSDAAAAGRGAGSSSRSRSATTSQSARELNAIVEKVFPADSVFRIDHYLGKETVQNLLALRFANQMFEPVWNANYVDHVQITMAEDIGIGGRAGYYDGIGAARDVIQNHLLQLLALTAMEEPVSFEAQDLRAEKKKVLSAVRIPDDLAKATARGPVRRRAGRAASEVVGYLEEDGVAAGLDAPRPTPRSGSRSTPAAGPACRSTCAPASGSASGSPRSPWSSSGRRTCRSATPRPRSSARTPSSSGSSPTRASPCGSAPRCPGARWRSAT